MGGEAAITTRLDGDMHDGDSDDDPDDETNDDATTMIKMSINDG